MVTQVNMKANNAHDNKESAKRRSSCLGEELKLTKKLNGRWIDCPERGQHQEQKRMN